MNFLGIYFRGTGTLFWLQSIHVIYGFNVCDTAVLWYYKMMDDRISQTASNLNYN